MNDNVDPVVGEDCIYNVPVYVSIMKEHVVCI